MTALKNRLKTVRQGQRVRAHQSGFAILELAAWLVMALPVALLVAESFGISHDQNAVQVIADEVIRETVGHVESWQPDGNQGQYEVDQDSLRHKLDAMAQRAFLELSEMALFTDEHSVTACYWVVNINPNSGLAESDQATDCATIGVAAHALSLNNQRQNLPIAQIAVPNPVSMTGESFAPLAVLLGLSVGGRFRGVSHLTDSVLIQHGVVRLLREELTL